MPLPMYCIENNYMSLYNILKSFFFSGKTTLLLLVVYATTMALATFLENDYGTPAVWAVVYDAWWFELIQALLAINFIGNIWKYNLLSWKKWMVFTFHIGFVVTLVGAFVTRYSGVEGTMSIREGETVDYMISNEMYFQTLSIIEGSTIRKEKKLKLSALTAPDFRMNIGSSKNPVIATCLSYTPNAEKVLIEGENNAIALAITNGRNREDIFLTDGERFETGATPIGFNTQLKGGINIFSEGDSLFIQHSDSISYLIMESQLAGSVEANKKFCVKPRILYNTSDVSFVIKEVHQNVKQSYVTASDKNKAANLLDHFLIQIECRGEKTIHDLFVRKGVLARPILYQNDQIESQFLVGPKVTELPFQIHLRDFQLERYPGSRSPSSYASEVTVIDEGYNEDYRIFMNNVLDYKGYRFFQASYDTDELGTVLSVNKDSLGTNITYIGYTLLTLGMFFSLFGRNTRFQFLNRQLDVLKKKKMNLPLVFVPLFLIFGSTFSSAQHSSQVDSLGEYYPVPIEYSSKFGRLMVQDMDGRIKPLNTLASELCRKLFRATTFSLENSTQEFDVNQLVLGLNKDPQFWQHVPLVKVDPEKLNGVLVHIGKIDAERIAFSDFFDEGELYILSDEVEAANAKKPAERNAFDKEILAVDERFNLLYQALTGDFLRIFPKRGDTNNTWFSHRVQHANFPTEDSLFVSGILNEYFHDINNAQVTGDWEKVDQTYRYIKTYQDVLGKDVMPSTARVEAELKYNALGLFNKLFPIYWMLGLVLLILAMMKIFLPTNKVVKSTYLVIGILVIVAFFAQTYNMGLRWYAGDYPPWSNGYEMIILVAWFLVLFGLAFAKKTDFALPLATLFAGTLLFVAFLDWLNPEITNLVPVLKSYWLKIHVAIIVASYAPLGLCALLGLMSLVLIILNGQQHNRMSISIKEMTILNEISMTMGLYLLTIGTFLGGVWANESWGRYWAWDPKETWALISIIVYAIVTHMRLVPKLQGDYIFSIASVVAFFSIIMTSFGVNYYLSGLHSYAQGDPVPIPMYIYVIVMIVAIIGCWAYWKNKKYLESVK